MTKTPEELKADWNAGKLEDGFYYVLTTEDNIVAIAEAQCGDLLVDIPEMILKILAPVPSYDEYKAMQEELAKLKEKIKKKEELIQCLGSNIDELDVKKWFLSLKTTSSADC